MIQSRGRAVWLGTLRARRRRHSLARTTAMAPKKKAPAHTGLASVDAFGYFVCIACTIVTVAFFAPNTPVPNIVGGTLAFYGFLALVIHFACTAKKSNQS